MTCVTPAILWLAEFQEKKNENIDSALELHPCNCTAVFKLCNGADTTFYRAKLNFCRLAAETRLSNDIFNDFSFSVKNEKFLRRLDNIDPNLHFHLNFKGKSSKTLLKLLRSYLIMNSSQRFVT